MREALLAEARVDQSLGRWNRAISRLLPHASHPQVARELVRIFRRLGQWRQVRRYARGDDPEALVALAECRAREGDYEGALELLERARREGGAQRCPEIAELRREWEHELERVRGLPRLAFVCAEGLDGFLGDLVRGLSGRFWARKFCIRDRAGIARALGWAEVVWLEWANEVAVVATRMLEDRPCVVRLHSYEAFTPLPRHIRWERVNCLVLVAHHVREILRRSAPGLERAVRVEVVPNGLDLERAPFRERAPGHDVAWVAHISHKKNPSLLLQVARALVELDPRYRLHVAGDFQDLRYETYLRYMTKRMGLEEHLVFWGWVYDMEELWGRVQHLLSTSVHESFGYNVMEAMARGIKPTVHEFFGALELWPPKLLFRTVPEAVEQIASPEYDSRWYRQLVEVWDLRRQVSRLSEILQEALGQGGRR